MQLPWTWSAGGRSMVFAPRSGCLQSVIRDYVAAGTNKTCSEDLGRVETYFGG